MLNCSHRSPWDKSVWTNPSKKSPSRGRFHLAAETGIEALLFSPVDCCLSVASGQQWTLLERCFWPWCSHHLPPAIPCQPRSLLTAPTSCLLCQLFLLTLSAALLCQPVCHIPFISRLFISTLAVLSSPAIFVCNPYRVSVLLEGYSDINRSTWSRLFFFFFGQPFFFILLVQIFFYIEGVSHSIPVGWLNQSERVDRLAVYTSQIHFPQFYHLAMFNRNLAKSCKSYLIYGRIEFDQRKLLIDFSQLPLLSDQSQHSPCLVGLPTEVSRERLLVCVKISAREQKVN